MSECVARFNKVVTCQGRFVKEAGLCSKHMVLYEIWIDEHEGYRVYRTEYPRNWKRSIFHKWLNEIGAEAANKIYEKACVEPAKKEGVSKW